MSTQGKQQTRSVTGNTGFSHVGFKEALRRKKEIESLIPGLKNERFMNSIRRGSAQREAADAEARVNSLIHNRGNGNEAGLSERYRGELVGLRADAEGKRGTADRLLAQEKKLSGEVVALQSELDGLALSRVSKDVLLSHCERFAVLENTVAEITRTIALQEQVIRQAKASVPAPSNLQARKEELLAEIATAEARARELADVDRILSEEAAEIAASKKAELSDVSRILSEQSMVISDAEKQALESIDQVLDTVNGLRRKLVEAEKAAAEFRQERPEVLHLLLVGEAETAYEEYRRLADELSARFGQLMALDKLIVAQGAQTPGASSSSIVCGAHMMRIPAFNLPLRPLVAHLPALVSGNQFDYAAALAAEKERLRGMGIGLA